MKLVLDNIEATYISEGRVLPVLKGITLQAKEGEFVSIIGPSGSGKSTILKIAAGLLQPDSGRVMVDNADLTGRPRLVGYMPQKDLLFPWKTLLENAAMPLVAAGKTKKEAHSKVLEMLPMFGLEGFAHYYPHQLSGGMRQRGALLRTMLIESGILLLDEPFASLDAITRLVLQEWLLEIWDKFRRTVLFVTHSIDEAIYLSDRVYVVTSRPGKIALEQKIELERPRSKEVMTTSGFSIYKEQMLNSLGQPKTWLS
jgi:ABC-type nitrate/sulfonate/bicarbonate transport system ATPase subunit